MVAASATNGPAPAGIKRSASISLLRGRSPSLRRNDSTRKTATATRFSPPTEHSARMATPVIPEESWSDSRVPQGGDPAVSYAVTITGGATRDKSKDKKRVFGRILPKKNGNSSAALADLAKSKMESEAEFMTSRQRRAGTIEERNHRRSNSALSFFQPDDALVDRSNEEEITALPAVVPDSKKLRPSKREAQKTSPMSRYNPARAPARPRLETALPSQTKSAPQVPRSSSVPNVEISPSQPTRSRSSSSVALQPHHPPRKSSLPESTIDASEPALESAKQALVESLELSAKHRRMRSKELESPLRTSDTQPPAPPPKDTAKNIPSNSPQAKPVQGLNLVLPSPFDHFSAIFKDMHGLNSPVADNGLPSPRLRQPRVSKLSARRTAVPRMISLPGGTGKSSDVVKVMAIALSPVQSSRAASSACSSLISPGFVGSPVIAQAIVGSYAKAQPVQIAVAAVATHPPQRQPPAPPVKLVSPALAVPLLESEAVRSQSRELISQNSDTQLRLPNPQPRWESDRLPVATAATAVKSPKRRSLNMSGVYVTSSPSGERTIRKKKSVHRRRMTGVRPGVAEARRSRTAERGADTPLTNLFFIGGQQQAADSAAVPRRNASPHENLLPARLTPPQLQGEWATDAAQPATGRRRQPSPLRKGSRSSDATHQRHRTPSVSDGKSRLDSSHGGLRNHSVNKDKARGAVYTTASREYVPPAATSKNNRQRDSIANHSNNSTYGAATMSQKTAARASRAIHTAYRNRSESEGSARSGHSQSITTAEESIQRMMAKQHEQQQALRARLLLDKRRPRDEMATTAVGVF